MAESHFPYSQENTALKRPIKTTRKLIQAHKEANNQQQPHGEHKYQVKHGAASWGAAFQHTQPL